MYLAHVDLMLGQRRRRWINFKTTSGQCLVTSKNNSKNPTNTGSLPNTGLMSDQRRRQWTIIKTKLVWFHEKVQTVRAIIVSNKQGLKARFV